ncbi:MAG: ADP-ribosylglycohydrolase family protein [Muribaculaceae bacterium]|nr:ADP-ribosylglycohydrolase family protein [Muribaculaceae bacterium]
MEYEKLRDKCRGSLVGGAVGDALGYEVEFMSLSSIQKRFGEKGISRFVLDKNGVAQFSDDTQMTLFTLEGLRNGVFSTNVGKPQEILPHIEKAYLNWYRTQTGFPHCLPESEYSKIPSLWSRRAPGMTCLASLESIDEGLPVVNNSKGCGGVMRVAPIGIFAGLYPDKYSLEDAAILAGLASEITHKHIASTFSSALLAIIVARCIRENKVDQLIFHSLVEDGVSMLLKIYRGYDKEFEEFSILINKALSLGKGETNEKEAIRELGEGWVGDEAIAIAIFSVMRHIDNFEDCIVCAVNHDGDSDSTGAVAGNIIGAILGYSAIPPYYLESLEIEPIIVSAVDDL